MWHFFHVYLSHLYHIYVIFESCQWHIFVVFACHDFFVFFFNWRYGKAAISKERKKSARYNEDVEDFPESCAADKVDAAVDYLINQVRLQDGDINAQDKYGMLLNSWINYLLNSCFFQTETMLTLSKIQTTAVLGQEGLQCCSYFYPPLDFCWKSG